jgi:hypothetical protein
MSDTPEDVRLGGGFDPLVPDAEWALHRRGDRLVMATRRAATGTSGERDWPLAAGAWIASAIRDGFWRSAEDGGFGPRVLHVEAAFDGERLELRRAWGLGPGGEPGFTLTSLDRMTAAGYPIEFSFSDEWLIRGGLLDLFGAAAPPSA